MPDTINKPNTMLRSGATVYLLNGDGCNRWDARVQPGTGDDGKRITDAECEAVARKLAAVDDLLKAARRALAVLKATNGQTAQPGNVLDALEKAIAKASS